LNKLEGKTEITDAQVIQDIQYELVEEAKKTDVKFLPLYEPIPIPKLIKSIDEINKSLSYLDNKDKAYFQSKISGDASFNLSLDFTPETIEDLLTKESLSNESILILKVKNPEYLCTSMWELKHNNKIIFAKILHESWLVQFQQRKIDIRPGDSLKAKVNIIVKYGHDNNVIGISHEIIEVLEVLPLNNTDQANLFEL